MKKKLLIFLLIFFALVAKGQIENIDSLKHSLSNSNNDATRIECLNYLFFAYLWNYPDSATPYIHEELILATKMNEKHALTKAYSGYTFLNIMIGDYPEALHAAQNCVKAAEQSNIFHDMVNGYTMLAAVYIDEGDYQQAIKYCYLAKSILETNRTSTGAFGTTLDGLTQAYEKSNQLDSALKYANELKAGNVEIHGKVQWAPIPFNFANIYSKLKKYPEAITYYHSAIDLAREDNNTKDLMDGYLGLAKVFKKTGQIDSSLFFAYKVLALSKSAYYMIVKIESLNLIADIYKLKHNSDSVSKFLELSIGAKDRVFSVQKMMKVQDATFREEMSQIELAEEAKQGRNKIILYSTIAALIVFLLIACILWRNNYHKQKAFALLAKQKQEIDNQKSKAEQTLEELRNTQSRLIQSEKMASLGELTAGIAHEIQNPLNFVNNFSEVNLEMNSELKDKLNKLQIPAEDKVEIEELIDTIKTNEEKINQHGKRAEAIVKGMLQHSRQSAGEKEMTDINASAEEYLRLAYHGLKAKDKDFNATIKTDFDESIYKINIVAQDIGRVLINLYNNAFYAVTEKKKQQLAGYEPTVSVSTRKSSNQVFISVTDNGDGISQKILNKIFQPFFTTKPTGRGTGLGLSLSYDIVKAHGGEITVNTVEQKFASFVIQLPV